MGLLNAVGAEVVLYDGNEKLKIEDIEKKLGTYKAEIVLGELTKELQGQFGFTGYQSGCAD